MILAQVRLTWGAVSWPDRSARVAAGLLSVACAASAISGFFDGQLAREDLSAAVVAGQWVLVTVTAGVGALAFARPVELRRSPTCLTNAQPPTTGAAVARAFVNRPGESGDRAVRD